MISTVPARAILRFRFACFVFLFGLAGFFGVQAVAGQSNTPDPAVENVPVFVSDFELHSAGPKPKAEGNAAEEPRKSNQATPAVYNDAEAASEQARRLTDFFRASLLEALNRKGFPAAREDGQKAPAGVLIRGVFAEVDARNRIRRALLGGGSPNPQFLLYVGIFNLARQDEPLYELAPEEQSHGELYGPVITLNAYIPLVRYEVDKNPSEDDVRKICEQIAANLVSLLAENAEAFSK